MKKKKPCGCWLNFTVLQNLLVALGKSSDKHPHALMAGPRADHRNLQPTLVNKVSTVLLQLCQVHLRDIPQGTFHVLGPYPKI